MLQLRVNPNSNSQTIEGAAPPTYDSLYGRIKEAKREHGTGLQFFKSVATILSAAIGGIACIAVAVVLLAIPVVQLYYGVNKKDDCTINSKIPLYLIVSGASGVAAIVMQVLSCMCSDDNGESKCALLTHIQSLLNLFNFAWFICGNVWVYKVHGEVVYDDTASEFFCDKTAYLLAFWCITSAYIMLGAMCLLGILLCMCMVCFGAATS
eukprot:sb/3470303/